MTVTNFSELDLDERLIDALRDKGYERPTAIQAAAIPPAMDGRDVLGSAPTGTGKTAAFLLPALQHLLDFPRKKSGPPRILILTPTRELAMQVADQARELAKHTQLDIATITGGVAYMNHAEVFSENQDIVVATTGRLLQYIKEENFDCRAVETLILDEADRMLDMGFAQDIETIAAETRWRKQTLLFSATLEGEAIREFAERILNEPVELEADPSRRERKRFCNGITARTILNTKPPCWCICSSNRKCKNPLFLSVPVKRYTNWSVGYVKPELTPGSLKARWSRPNVPKPLYV